METSFTELRSKFVVNVTDGKNLGRTCDIIFSFPEAHVFGIVVPGKRFRIFKNNDLFIPLKNIIKIRTESAARSTAPSLRRSRAAAEEVTKSTNNALFMRKNLPSFAIRAPFS